MPPGSGPRRRSVLHVLVAVLGCVALSPAPAAAAETRWLCAPGVADSPCTGDLDQTVVGPDGTRRERPVRAARRPAIDCFYVYPTVTRASGLNAPLEPEPAVTGVTSLHARPFSQVCRVFAPLYRQLTGAGFAAAEGDPRPVRIALGDVRAAWREYLRRYNKGRPVVLIGHSQGTMMLRALARAEIDDRPAVRRLLLSALLIGGNVQVRRGSDIGGDFDHLPACRKAGQRGCVVAYSTYDTVPPRTAGFPRPGTRLSALIGVGAAGQQVLCTNPAALRSGGPAPLSSLLGTTAYPGLYTARCRTKGDRTWLGVTSSPTDARAGDRFPVGTPAAGLHLWDMSIALGDLIALVERQVAALRATR